MIKTLLLFLVVISLTSCDIQKSEKTSKREPLIMVEQSEMALLMNEMFAFNESIKHQIKEGKLTNSFPEHFNKIHTAILTDPADRDSLFNVNANHFVKAQRNIFNNSTSDLNELTSNYNDAVSLCISCHEKTCVGPIPRIKKLYINTK